MAPIEWPTRGKETRPACLAKLRICLASEGASDLAAGAGEGAEARLLGEAAHLLGERGGVVLAVRVGEVGAEAGQVGGDDVEALGAEQRGDVEPVVLVCPEAVEWK